MRTFRFQGFQVYKEAKLFNREIYLLTKSWSRKDYSLADQLRRASISICLNIAEGSAKASDRDFRRYLQNSLGSVNEVVSCLDIAMTLSLITSHKYDNLMEKAKNIAKQLGGFSRKLGKKNSS